MPRIANPYGAQTPIGASMGGLARLALAMRGRAPGADKGGLYDAQSGMYDAHADLYGAQAGKVDAETAGLQRLNDLRSDAGIARTAALRYGIPDANVTAMYDYAGGKVPMPPAMPAGVDRASVADFITSMRLGYGDRTSNADEIAKANNTLGLGRMREGVLGGTVDPTRAAQATFATSGRAPFDNMGGDAVMNIVSGEVGPMTPLGAARVRERNAAAAHQGASAGAAAALQRQRDLENRAGVRIGPPLPVDDPEAGVIYTSPLSAPGRAPAARPTGRSEPLVPVVIDGQTVYVPRSEAAGEVVPPRPGPQARPQPVRGLTGAQSKALEAAVDEQFPGLAKEDRSAIIARATAEATNPASPTYMNPAGSVGAVMQGVEIEDNTFSKNRLKDRAGFAMGRTTPLRAPSAASAPTPGANLKGIVGSTPPAGAVPPPAQRVVGSVYETPRGPMRWTGTGWVPSGT